MEWLFSEVIYLLCERYNTDAEVFVTYPQKLVRILCWDQSGKPVEVGLFTLNSRKGVSASIIRIYICERGLPVVAEPESLQSPRVSTAIGQSAC